MKRVCLFLAIAVCSVALAVGCIGCFDREPVIPPNQAIVKLKGNVTTGYAWTCTISPDGVVRELSNIYTQDEEREPVPGTGGTNVFTFEAIAEGEAEITFSYERDWEDIPALEEVVYKAIVDADGNLTLELVDATSMSYVITSSS